MNKKSDERLVVGLDIGTSKVLTIVGETNPVGEVEIIGVGHHPARGMRKGVVSNIESTVQSIQRAVEEAELRSPSLEGLVERREHDVAHAGAHLPEERAAVREEHPQRPANPLPRRDGRAARVAALVGQGEVVEPAHDRGVHRALGGAVQQEPLPRTGFWSSWA